MNAHLHVLSAEDVYALVSRADVLASQREVFPAMFRGEATLAPRALLPGGDESVAFAYLARAGKGAPAVVKMGSINPGNTALGLPGIHATIMVCDEVTGALKTIMDGESVTLLRTAAATAVAVQALTAAKPEEIGFIGSGPQVMSHIEFLHELFPSACYRVFARSEERSSAMRVFAKSEGVDISITTSAKNAITGVDVAITATNATSPLVDASWFRTTELLVSIGSFAPGRCEFGADTIALAKRIIVDDVDTAIRQAGPIVEAIEKGGLSKGDLTSLGEILNSQQIRTNADDLWIYNSVGLGIQDAALAGLLMKRAENSGRGKTIDF